MSLSLVLVYMELSRNILYYTKHWVNTLQCFNIRYILGMSQTSFFVPPDRSQSMNIEFLHIACPDPILVIS